MHTVFETTHEAYRAFRNRAEAGERWVAALGLKRNPAAVVVGVPRGGVLVAEPIARAMEVPLELVLVRKLPVPHAPEAGFGAVALDGSRVLNDEMMREIHLSPGEVDRITEKVLAEVRRRATEYVGHDRPPAVGGKEVFLVDDGLATGFTVIAAARMLRRQDPKSLFLCVPVSPVESVERVESEFDRVYCLVAQERLPFAVASFYDDFSDPTDEEVRGILRRSREPTCA